MAREKLKIGCVLLVGGSVLSACGAHVEGSGATEDSGSESGGGAASGGTHPWDGAGGWFLGPPPTGGYGGIPGYPMTGGYGGFVGVPLETGGAFTVDPAGGANAGGAPGLLEENTGGVGGHFVGQPPHSGGLGGATGD